MEGPQPTKPKDTWLDRFALIAAALVALAALGYGIDWAVWRVRVAQHGGMGTVEVNNVSVFTLKGKKEEYFDNGTEQVQCAQSLFPHGGASACWWLERNREVVTRD